jgi:hypothetical protein
MRNVLPVQTIQGVGAVIEAEQTVVASSGELTTRFDDEIQATLARFWGEMKVQG